MSAHARALPGVVAGSLAILALVAGATRAGAQCDPQTERDVLRLTIDAEEKIWQLEKIKRQIEVEHDILLIYPGGAGLVRASDAAGLFSHAVLLGAMDPDSIAPEVRKMRAATTYYLRQIVEPDLIAARACLERIKGGPQAPPAPAPPSAAATPIDWPVPMNWVAVKGSVSGSYLAQCAGRPNIGYPAVRSAGTYRLEFLGDGSVNSVFADDQRMYKGSGSIKADGTAGGDSRSTNPEAIYLRWTARFERVGIDLHMPSHTLDVMGATTGPQSILVDCAPGYMRPE
jgi:hypothetical protein